MRLDPEESDQENKMSSYYKQQKQNSEDLSQRKDKKGEKHSNIKLTEALLQRECFLDERVKDIKTEQRANRVRRCSYGKD